ncbi:MAG: hypothetical protein M1828_007437 [Chrysothrix sp. TS-e1954]|nr:MAG: hypothetical protein M1828_007437 [Chrysothrix sp. TS-e1954]
MGKHQKTEASKLHKSTSLLTIPEEANKKEPKASPRFGRRSSSFLWRSSREVDLELDFKCQGEGPNPPWYQEWRCISETCTHAEWRLETIDVVCCGKCLGLCVKTTSELQKDRPERRPYDQGVFKGRRSQQKHQRKEKTPVNTLRRSRTITSIVTHGRRTVPQKLYAP